MPSTPDLATVETRARDLLNSRIESVRKLAVTRTKVEEAIVGLADAQAIDLTAYNAALRGGWTTDELRKLGFDEPEKRTRGRRAAARAGRSATDGQANT